MILAPETRQVLRMDWLDDARRQKAQRADEALRAEEQRLAPLRRANQIIGTIDSLIQLDLCALADATWVPPSPSVTQRPSNNWWNRILNSRRTTGRPVPTYTIHGPKPIRTLPVSTSWQVWAGDYYYSI